MTRHDSHSFRTGRPPAPSDRHRFLFVLLHGYRALDLTLATEALSEANRNGAGFDWTLHSVTGHEVASRSGLQVAVDGALGPVSRQDTILLMGGPDLIRTAPPKLLHWLRKAASFGATIGAIGGASGVLAGAGLLNETEVAAHWTAAAAMREAFPDAEVRETLYHIGPRRMTCAGGMATLDMMLALIAAHQSEETAHDTAAALACSRVRAGDSRQVFAAACRHGRRSPHLIDAIRLMHRTLDAPLSAKDIAREVGVSSRQLERLFSTYLDITPKRFRDQLRLDHAQRLMQQTELSVAEISVACGFNSPSHFSKLYQRQFGIFPSADRGIPAPLVGRLPLNDTRQSA